MMLVIEDLQASYGGSRILQGINLSIQQGEIKALMGRNGMGKTTLLKTIMGLLIPHCGSIIFKDKNIEGSGIGLTLVDHIVKAHDGEISLESNRGKGTRIRVRLPVQGRGG